LKNDPVYRQPASSQILKQKKAYQNKLDSSGSFYQISQCFGLRPFTTCCQPASSYIKNTLHNQITKLTKNTTQKPGEFGAQKTSSITNKKTRLPRNKQNSLIHNLFTPKNPRRQEILELSIAKKLFKQLKQEN
jgi:hypothetical protein